VVNDYKKDHQKFLIFHVKIENLGLKKFLKILEKRYGKMFSSPQNQGQVSAYGRVALDLVAFSHSFGL